MGKPKTIDSFFKRKDDEQDSKRHKASPSEPQPVTNEGPQPVANEAPLPPQPVTNEGPQPVANEAPQPVTNEAPQPVANEADLNNLERDPAKRKQIWEYPVNSREQVRRAYLSLGPYQIHLTEYANKGSKKEQMAIVLRFVDVEGIIRERFLDLVHVRDTLSLTLKTSMWKQLLHYQFDVSKIRGQGYDGASNMRGEWNGLQALVLNDCPYAYYVHCFAHRLQLALVAASKEVIPVHQFFTNLAFIINVVCASSKRHDELQKAKADEIKKLLELGEIKSGKGLNQVGTLRRAGDTRWGSHFNSVCSLLKMFDVTRVVLQGIIDDRSHTTAGQRGDADAGYVHMKSFEFVFILHMLKELMGKTNTLSQEIQKKSQDIVNAMELVSATKVSLNNYRNNGFDQLLAEVIFFCSKHQVDMPDMNAPYTSTRYRPRKTDLHVTFEHYYRVDLFTATLDKQIHELNSRFNEQAMELLSLSSSLVSKEINIDDICLLVEKYYPEDFTEHEITKLRYQLETFNNNLTKSILLSGVSTLADLCKCLVETKKHETYYLVYRVVRLISTLPVSTATTERAFSAMKIFKTRLRNKMSDSYLADSLVINIEREIAEKIDSMSIIDAFKDLRDRKADL